MALGAFYCTFDLRAMYFCKAITLCTGYYVPKKKWLDCLNCDVGHMLKMKILKEFQNKERHFLFLQKQRDQVRLKTQANYEGKEVVEYKQVVKEIVEKWWCEALKNAQKKTAAEENEDNAL